MNRAELLSFLRAHRMAVQASVAIANAPQAAVVGIAITDKFEIVFDTLASTRKVRNLRANSKVAFVIGGLANGEERSVQYEGVVDEPQGVELEELKACYFEQFPDRCERAKWPGLVYVRARPTWLRYCDYGRAPPLVLELTDSELERLA